MTEIIPPRMSVKEGTYGIEITDMEGNTIRVPSKAVEQLVNDIKAQRPFLFQE